MKKITARTRTPRKRAATNNGRLIPPKGGATVRMYRTGHGDCFLTAFEGKTEDKPVYVLIDCGYKPGSPAFINTKIDDIVKNMIAATGGHVDVAVITHEHQDHVNGISATRFSKLTIGEAWFAWTEDPNDDLANDLRKTFKDKLLGLLAARNRLAGDGDDERVKRIDEFLAFELGGDDQQGFIPPPAVQLGAADFAVSMNKTSMKVFKDKASDGVKYIRPHESIFSVPGAKDLRVYALGPPRDAEQVEDLNPRENEQFHDAGFAAASPGIFFAAAVADRGRSPFANRYQIPIDGAFESVDYGRFFSTFYGKEGPLPCVESLPRGENETEPNPDWRRIDNEWLFSAEQLALDMNDYTNNASLVLAFELGKGGKVLLFAADAQRGNWASWGKKNWKDGDKTVTAKDLLARTVLYKVGHHGSHNATLNGKLTDEIPNLSWMATADHAREFTAMITAVRAWAETQNGWNHPLPAIKDALIKKASGRVFQTDTDLDKMKIPDNVPVAEWKRFTSRVSDDPLYFDISIT